MMAIIAGIAAFERKVEPGAHSLPASPPQKRAVSTLAGSLDIGQNPTVSPPKSSPSSPPGAVIG
jgi:hypothetical protein